MSRKLLIVIATCALCCTYSVTQSKSLRPGPVPQQQAIAAPTTAIVPLSPEQMPATPPQVAFSNGFLTIVADNSTLGDVLRAVHRQTGAAIEVPGNATERVVGKFGPGAPRDVLSSLLNGSHFNYVLLGSATNSSALDRVILTSRPAGTEEAAAQQQQPNVGMAAGTPTPTMPGAAGQPAENADFNDDSGEVLQQPVDGNGDDQMDQAQTEDQQPPQPTQPFAPGGAVKTPEQLLQELQQRQQQLQQQQQQGGQPFPPTPMGGVPPQPQPPQ